VSSCGDGQESLADLQFEKKSDRHTDMTRQVFLSTPHVSNDPLDTTATQHSSFTIGYPTLIIPSRDKVCRSVMCLHSDTRCGIDWNVFHPVLYALAHMQVPLAQQANSGVSSFWHANHIIIALETLYFIPATIDTDLVLGRFISLYSIG